MSSQESWEQVVSQKRANRDKLLAPFLVDDVDKRTPRVHQIEHRSRLDSDLLNQITDVDSIPALLHKIQVEGLAAEDVVRAYIQRAVVAHQLVSPFRYWEDTMRDILIDGRPTVSLKLPLRMHWIKLESWICSSKPRKDSKVLSMGSR